MTSKRILIADPDEAQLAGFRQHFSHGHWTLATAVNGLECLARLRDFRPHVLVLEPELPWGGGSGVLGCLRDDPRLPSVLVMVLTLARDLDELSRVLKFTVDGFLLKPITAEALARQIHFMLPKRQRR